MDVSHLLEAAPAKDPATLKRLLKDACDHWNGKGKTPFHIVFQTEAKEVAEVQARWAGLAVL